MNGVGLIAYVAVFGAIIYFLMILPQQRRAKKAKMMIESAAVGSDIITIGGICGKVVNLKDDEVVIETSVKKTQIVMCKWAIKEVVKKLEA